MSDQTYWEFRVLDVHRVVDGDTFDLKVDLGFRQYGVYRFRLAGIDTPEIYGGKEEGADEAKTLAEDLLHGWLDDPEFTLWVRTHDEQTFNRWVADVFALPESSGALEDLASKLREAGFDTSEG